MSETKRHRKKYCKKCGVHTAEKNIFRDSMGRLCYYWHCLGCGYQEPIRHYVKKPLSEADAGIKELFGGPR
jgi:RNase P subunit RPR2